MANVIERHHLPMVAINLLTHNRSDLAVRTIHQCLRHLKYDGVLKWFVTDHDSDPEHCETLLKTIPANYILDVYTGKGTIGQCWNDGLKNIFKHTGYYIRLEDDMCLKADLDITRYVKVMMTDAFMGMVRLGQMVDGLIVQSTKRRIFTHIGFEEDLFLEVGKSNQYCFSGHPAIFKMNFHKVYGFYSEEKLSAGELELDMDNKVRHTGGGMAPSIYFPWDLGRFGTWGAWDHVGTEKA